MSTADDDRTIPVHQRSGTATPAEAEAASSAENSDSTTLFPTTPLATESPRQPEPPLWRTGPAPTTTVVGLAVLVVAIVAGMYLGSDADVDLSLAGPVAALVVGLGLIAVGLLSLGRRSREAEDAPTP